jgi:hypothetical protein
VAYNTFPQVSDIINGVSQDVRNQLSALVGTSGQPVLIDYTNRIHKQILRFSRWTFLKSEPLYFLTQMGQSSYWVGPTGTGNPGTVETALNLPDVYQFKKDSVMDLSNQQALKWLYTTPQGPNLIDRTGAGRPGLPATFSQSLNDPNILIISPPPNNQNNTSPAPQVPIVNSAIVGGALPLRTYLLKVTFVDSLGGESTSTTTGAPLFIPAGQLATVKSPAIGYFGVLPDIFSQSGVQYNQYNVYAVQATLSNGVPQNEGTETKQNSVPISFGIDWTEPLGGLTTTGVSVPQQNTLQPLGAYVIKFEYYKNRIKLVTADQFLQIPDDYVDVVIAGVTWLSYKLMGKIQEAQVQYQLFKAGLTEMIADKNMFPEGVEFIRPDSNSYVNTQILGYLDPFFVSFIPITYLQWLSWGESWQQLVERVKTAVKLALIQYERKRNMLLDTFVWSVARLSKKLLDPFL